jgi:hypothetical protein
MKNTANAKTLKDIATFSLKPVVYIAGKVTGLPIKQVVAKFADAQNKLTQAGYYVINPTQLVHPKANWQQAMRICLSFLPHADFIYLLDNWYESEGATWENQTAKRLGIIELMHCPTCNALATFDALCVTGECEACQNPY